MKVNARQYTEVADVWCAGVEAAEYVAFLAGAYTRPLFSST